MAFNLPLQNYFSRTTGPAVYSRPSDWPVITDVATEVQFLFCDLGDATCSIRTLFTRTSGSQNIIIDWGDATTSTVTTTATTTTPHTYTPGTGTPCPSLGYTTFIIRVYFTGTGVSVLNNCNIMPILISGDTSGFQSCAVLEAYYGNSTQNATPVNFFSQGSNANSLGLYIYLQFVKLPATVSWTNWGSTFYGCIALLKVVMPTSNSAASSYSTAFQNCQNLLELTIPSNSTGITSLSNAFQNCYNLRSITLPTTLNSCSTFSTCFYNCYNLRSVTLPSVNVCSTFQLAFYQCAQLEWVKFTSMPTVVAVNMSNAFGTCTNLQNVYFPATGTATSIYDFSYTFSQCYQLKNIVFPSNINVSTFSNTFAFCPSLTSCILPTSAAACTTYANIFYLCYSLLKITLPAAPTAAVSIIDAFNQCWKLQEITIPSGYVFTSMATICTSCNSLKTFTWTPGIQNSLTSLASAFNGCNLLTSITMPSSMNSLTSLATAFNNCNSLTSITFPSSLNAVTSIQQCFAGSRLLTSVTLPTSMSACTNFSNVFADCNSLTSITLPNVVSTNTTTFSACFFQCFNLKTCVLPGAAQLSLVTSIGSMFQLCSNLVTLTNFDKIGSLTATPLMSATGNQYNRFTSGSAISFSGPLSGLNLAGLQSTMRADVQSVRLLNASAGQWTGSSPQINVSYTNMSTAQIVQLFNDMAAQGNVVSKTINITSATGAAALTAADRLIVTSKGWVITG